MNTDNLFEPGLGRTTSVLYYVIASPFDASPARYYKRASVMGRALWVKSEHPELYADKAKAASTARYISRHLGTETRVEEVIALFTTEFNPDGTVR